MNYKFTAEDFVPYSKAMVLDASKFAEIANAKIAPLVADNEKLLERVRDLYDLQGRIARQHDSEVNVLRDEITALKAKLEIARECLEEIEPALGDRLLAEGPLSKPYAHGVMKTIRDTIEELGRKA